MAEVELQSEDEPFVKPDFIADEVTATAASTTHRCAARRSVLARLFARRIPITAASVTPVALAAKSSQSPLLLPPVQFSCSISISPLIITGASHAHIKSFIVSGVL